MKQWETVLAALQLICVPLASALMLYSECSLDKNATQVSFLGDVYWDLLAIGDNMEIYQGLDKKLVTGDLQMSVWTQTAYICLEFTPTSSIAKWAALWHWAMRLLQGLPL